MDYTGIKINRGTHGIFEEIEKNANVLCARGLIIFACIATILGILASIVDKSAYMTEVRICIAVIDVDCLLAAYFSLKKKEPSELQKYWLFLAWSLAICLAVSSVDSSVTLLYAVPVLLAVRYYSVLFTVVVSTLNIIFAFIPYIANVYKHAYPLDFIVLEEGTVITMAGDSLDGTVNALGSIDVTATITNMLTYGYLSTALFLVMISILAVMLSKFNRDNVIKQYNAARSRIEN